MIRSTNIRFNMDKPLHRAAWQCLQEMDKTRYRSYSNAIMLALVDYMNRQAQLESDPYLETREREERFVAQIIEAVERSMAKALPVFLSGCATGLKAGLPAASKLSIDTNPSPSDEDVDWGFVGE